MASMLYNLVIVSVIAECLSQSLFPDYAGCSPTYEDLEDTEKCTHTVYCKERVSGLEFTHNDKCSNFVLSNAHGRMFDPISLVFLNEEDSDFVPIFSDSYNHYLVYSIDLSFNNYASVPHLVSMPNLAKLIISTSPLLETAKLSNKNELPALTDVDYSANNINNIKVVPGEYEYKMLKRLNISYNSLGDIPEGTFDLFPNIESLDLSHNFLFKLDILTFEGIRKIQNLNLSNNRIAEIDSSLIRLRYLVTLDLGHNTIQTLKASDFAKFTSLQELKLDSNNISIIEKKIFENMVSLTTVDLQDNVLENIDQEIFTSTKKLTNVYLSKNKLKFLPKNLFQGKLIFNFTIEDNVLEGSLERGTFEGLAMVTELDLSFQHLSSVANYAFVGLQNLKTLLVNNNDVESLKKYSFKGLQKFKCLDLSYNRINELEIVTEDLISLQILTLHHNQIAHISSNNFVALGSLQLLDISHNNISYFEPNSFRSLQNLLNFKVSDNPLKGPIEEKIFDGLSLLPSLDISGTVIAAVNNGSFRGMVALRDLNVSHSNIHELQYNSLSYAKNIEAIDLSYNKLRVFEVNTTDLRHLKTLILENNMLQVISETLFNGLSVLNTVDLSHNQIRTIHKKAFNALEDMLRLDLSYNSDLEFNVSLVEKASRLADLFISGTKTETHFENIKNLPLTRLEMGHCSIQNVSRLNLYSLQRLETLVLSDNAVTKLEVGALSNLTALRLLDLSNNNLSCIQPGVFRENTYLKVLNISHNKLTEINYGIFLGLLYVEVVDLSYNKIKSLHRSRFYDIQHLDTLVADYNDIDYISDDEFLGTSLSKLSIGGNPIPCEIIASLQKKSFNIRISSLIKDLTKANINGITCNKDGYNFNSKLAPASFENSKLLQDIRNILYNLSKGQIYKEPIKINNSGSTYLSNMTEQQQKLNQHSLEIITSIKDLYSVSNMTSIINTNTNLLLGKILQVLSSKEFVQTSKPITVNEGNISSDGLIPYINKIKQDLEDSIAIEKQNVLALDDKIAKLNSIIDSSVTGKPIHEKLLQYNEDHSRSSTFTEVCVGLILVILVGFVIFKVYKSRLYIPRGWTMTSSTRNIAESMESANL